MTFGTYHVNLLTYIIGISFQIKARWQRSHKQVTKDHTLSIPWGISHIKMVGVLFIPFRGKKNVVLVPFRVFSLMRSTLKVHLRYLLKKYDRR